ncbi:class I lanthipeptide [[Flexibacter] sp. ATCC 35208]|nr:class I lanthipeptide [[Flexibacter] sp. ATCC 35208]
MKKKIKLNKKKIAELDKQTASQVKGGGTTSDCTVTMKEPG